MYRMLFALLVSFLAVHFMGKKVVPWLAKLHFGQTIYDLGPQTHKSKQGTPIMGGMMAAAAATVCVLVFHPAGWYGWQDAAVGLLGISLLSMAVGFMDDYIKAMKKRHEGLNPTQKLIGQFITSAAFAVWCFFNPMVGSAIRIPFTDLTWDLGWFYIPVMTLLVVFMVNSSNLQDGLDGLLSTVSSAGNVGWAAVALAALAAAGVGSQAGDTAYTVAIFMIAVAGGTLGFMRYNRFPAKVFQGDSGSMFIGGAACAAALILRQPLLLLLINFTMVMSSVSVILQRGYFKLTHGKRIFKMSPIHHHFELSGYTEPQIVSMYGVITAVLTVAAVLSAVGIK